jgi:nucleotide-binding universal stress UspA family protein
VEAAVTHRCGLVVIGTHGRRGMNRALMGSDAELVVRLSPVPVLLVRQPVVAAAA